MQKRTYILFFLAVVWAASGFSQTTNQTPREQVLKHLEGLLPIQQLTTTTSIVSVSTHQVAIQSIKSMGTNAVPVLIEVLSYQPERMDEWYERAYANAPASLRKHMSKPDAIARLREQAAQALFSMPETKDFLRDLLPLLQDSRTEVRRAASSVFSRHALKANPYLLLELVPLLKDDDAQVRKNVIYAVTFHVTTFPRAKTAIESALQDLDEEVRVAASQALLLKDNNHPDALKTLRSAFNSTNDWMRLHAAQVYLSKQMESPDLDRELSPVFNSVLTSTNIQFQCIAIMHLREWAAPLAKSGTRLTSTVPELQKLLTNASPYVRKEATNALLIIAPGVLAPAKP